MGQIIVRNLDDQVIARLKERARLTNQSLEHTVRNILFEAAKPSREEILAEMDRIRRRIGPVSLDATDLIREDRDSR
jgi:plasmid stability protein